MVISYLGGESFKIQFGDTVIAYNPVSKDSKLKSTTFGSDIALISYNHEDFNGAENAARGDKAPFVISGPGEYEIKGVFVKGLPSKSTYGTKSGEERSNTIYIVSLENMNLCFLGALGSADLSSETLEELEDVDILFVPVGGEGVLNATEADKLAVKLEPHIIIPMHYGSIGVPKALELFLKEAGESSPEKVDKLTLKKKDLEGKEGDIIVLEASA
jgi:L-ascorbate metabolism protein UlaG (beta-lactamase superfamily)